MSLVMTGLCQTRDDMASPDNKQASAWQKFLDQMHPGTNLALAREFSAQRDLTSFVNEPVPGPPAWQKLNRGFRCLSVFSMLNVFMNKYPSLTRCWNDLSKTFVAGGDRLDRLMVEGWVFCDFPIQETRQTSLSMFRDFLVEIGGVQEFQPFVDAMSGSRLGLHQDVGRTSKVMRFKELVSGKTTEVFRSILRFGKGEVFLSRIVRMDGVNFLFGDPRCWPKEYRNQVEDFALTKMFQIPEFVLPDSHHGKVEAGNHTQRFEAFMKIAGPYWMSCTVDDDAIPILSPAHFLSYYTRPEDAHPPKPPEH